jgi:hypothetical protein
LNSQSKVKGATPDNEFMNLNNPEERKLKKDLLKSKYTGAKRVQEVLSLIGFVVLFGACVYRIVVHYPTEVWWLFPSTVILGLLGADFFSGLVHWLADTWGTLETPVFGSTFIRSFREHHIDPTEMTRHDLIETNGDNALITLGILYLCSIKDLYHEDGSQNLLHYFTMSTWTIICFGSLMTNQIHKWSHTYKPPALVIMAQNCGLILSRKNHGVHHRPPFDKYYCITTGWLNPVLAYIDFWRRLEAVVTFLTGYVPREDDHRWTGLLPSPDVVVQAAKKRGTALSGHE